MRAFTSLPKTKPTDYMRTVQDYPEPGVNFYDMNSLFAQPIWSRIIAELAVDIQRIYTSLVRLHMWLALKVEAL